MHGDGSIEGEGLGLNGGGSSCVEGWDGITASHGGGSGGIRKDIDPIFL